MKRLYEFQVWKETEVEEPVISKDDKGEEVKILKKVKKYIPHKFFLRKPNRSLADEGDLFYGVQLNKAVKDGLLTRAQLATKFSDEIGTISKVENEKYVDLYLKILEKRKEYENLASQDNIKNTPESKEKLQAVIKEIAELESELRNFENTKQSVYDYTADVRARNKAIIWWMMNLSYYDDNKPFFEGGSYEEKLRSYDDLIDKEDRFLLSIVDKFLTLVNIWYFGSADTTENFDKIAKRFGINVNPEEPVKEEPLIIA